MTEKASEHVWVVAEEMNGSEGPAFAVFRGHCRDVTKSMRDLVSRMAEGGHCWQTTNEHISVEVAGRMFRACRMPLVEAQSDRQPDVHEAIRKAIYLSGACDMMISTQQALERYEREAQVHASGQSAQCSQAFLMADWNATASAREAFQAARKAAADD